MQSMQYAVLDTPWGWFGYVAKNRRLLATYLPGAKAKIRQAIAVDWPDALPAGDLLPRFRRQVLRYFQGKTASFGVELDLAAQPAFRRKVLAACRKIPYGRTASYADLARVVHKPAAARAVGGAMAHNPLPLVVPCHRVLRSDGSLGGFSSPLGTKQKQRMLLLENALTCFDRP